MLSEHRDHGDRQDGHRQSDERRKHVAAPPPGIEARKIGRKNAREHEWQHEKACLAYRPTEGDLKIDRGQDSKRQVAAVDDDDGDDDRPDHAVANEVRRQNRFG